MTNPDELLKASEVAKLLRVTSKTVGRWARDGKLPVVRTVGGHMRFRRADVEPLLAPR
jgi:excisionase family DNA binding protein